MTYHVHNRSAINVITLPTFTTTVGTAPVKSGDTFSGQDTQPTVSGNLVRFMDSDPTPVTFSAQR